MALARLDSTVTFGQAGIPATVPVTGLASQTQVGTVTPIQTAFNEPGGLNQLVNTGAMNTPPSQVLNGTWSSGGSLPVTFTMFSAPTWTSPYQVGQAANLVLTSSQDSASTGYRQLYPTLLPGGFQPVTWGCPLKYPTIGQPGYWTVSAGTYYFRMRIRYSPGWNNNGNVGTKILFIHTAPQISNNYLSGSDADDRNTHQYLTIGSQNPSWTYDSESDGFGSTKQGGNMADGNWHTAEWLVQNSWPVGTSNATISGWLDNVKVISIASRPFWASSETGLITRFDIQSTFGGGGNSPPASAQPMYFDIDQLYMSAA